MPQVRIVTTLAAGASNTNILNGQLFERVGGRGARLRLYQAQTSGIPGDVTFTFISGSDVIAQDAAMGVQAGGVQVPESQVASGVGLPGDQLVISLTNGAAAARDVDTLLDIENA